MFHTPAEENAILFPRTVLFPNDGPLRSGAGMQSQAGMMFTHAVFDHDIMRYLPANAVTVIVCARLRRGCECDYSPGERYSRRNCLQLGICFPIAIQNQVFDLQILNRIATQDREKRGNGGVVREPKVLSQRFVEFETVPRAGHQSSFHTVFAASFPVTGPQTDSISQVEFGGILERYFLIVPVAVHFEG